VRVCFPVLVCGGMSGLHTLSLYTPQHSGGIAPVCLLLPLRVPLLGRARRGDTGNTRKDARARGTHGLTICGRVRRPSTREETR
jgi:hypothetical protein